jgi:hypothetical protein
MRSNSVKSVARPVTSRLCLYRLSMEPKEPATIWSSGWRPWVRPFSLTSSSCGSVSSEHPDGVFALVGGAGDGRGADKHELAQQALVLDDADVLFDDRAARQTLGERGQVGHAAD